MKTIVDDIDKVASKECLPDYPLQQIARGALHDLSAIVEEPAFKYCWMLRTEITREVLSECARRP